MSLSAAERMSHYRETLEGSNKENEKGKQKED